MGECCWHRREQEHPSGAALSGSSADADGGAGDAAGSGPVVGPGPLGCGELLSGVEGVQHHPSPPSPSQLGETSLRGGARPAGLCCSSLTRTQPKRGRQQLLAASLLQRNSSSREVFHPGCSVDQCRYLSHQTAPRNIRQESGIPLLPGWEGAGDGRA